MTKGQILGSKPVHEAREEAVLFPAGDYVANLTPDGKIEIVKDKNKIFFSFSQFREKLSLGEFIMVDPEM